MLSLGGGVSQHGFLFPYPAAPLRRGIAARFSLPIPRRPFAAGYRSTVFPSHTPPPLCGGVSRRGFLFPYPAAPLRRGITARFSFSIPRRPFAAGYHSAVFSFHTPPALCGGVSRHGFPFPYPAAPLRRGIVALFSLPIPPTKNLLTKIHFNEEKKADNHDDCRPFTVFIERLRIQLKLSHLTAKLLSHILIAICFLIMIAICFHIRVVIYLVIKLTTCHATKSRFS